MEAMTYTHSKLETYILESHLKTLQHSLQEVDVGHIGNYDSYLSYIRMIGT